MVFSPPAPTFFIHFFVSLNTGLSELNLNMTRHWKKADKSNVECLGLTYNADTYNPDGTRGAFEIWLNFSDNTKAVLGFNNEHIWFNYFINDQWFNRWVK